MTVGVYRNVMIPGREGPPAKADQIMSFPTRTATLKAAVQPVGIKP